MIQNLTVKSRHTVKDLDLKFFFFHMMYNSTKL
jgi:hypothetical protein